MMRDEERCPATHELTAEELAVRPGLQITSAQCALPIGHRGRHGTYRVGCECGLCAGEPINWDDAPPPPEFRALLERLAGEERELARQRDQAAAEVRRLERELDRKQEERLRGLEAARAAATPPTPPEPPKAAEEEPSRFSLLEVD